MVQLVFHHQKGATSLFQQSPDLLMYLSGLSLIAGAQDYLNLSSCSKDTLLNQRENITLFQVKKDKGPEYSI